METSNVLNDTVKSILADILYLDSTDTISNTTRIFSELGLNSIDFIDLCFALKKHSNKNITPENLWPFHSMASSKEFFDNNQWTMIGWNEVCKVLNISATTSPEDLRTLYQRFTVDYVVNRVGALSV